MVDCLGLELKTTLGVHDVFHLLETFYSQKGHACYTT